ncbi:MAG: porin family protein, partial [Chitinophagaceae bacterium]
MKKIIFFGLLVLPFCGSAQIGVKAGLNFSNVTSASSINNSSRTGYHAGLLLGSPFKKLLGFRTELMYSKQGYDYGSGKGNVGLDYIMSADFVTVGITRYFQLQLGFQVAYLLNAKADSSNEIAGLPGAYKKILDISNRIDYGFAGGVEIHPAGGLLIGARINISLSKLYKDAASSQDGSFSGMD